MKHMKFTVSLLTIVLSLLLVQGCSEHVPDKHEQLYLDTVDSLKLYQNMPYLTKELAGNEKARDLLELDYIEFKEKHDWNDKEMEVFADIIQGHVNIAKTLSSFNSLSD